MSACSAQAMSQVGCRLMVASSANTSRPLAPAAWGDIACALATKAAMSSEVDDRAAGSGPALPALAFCAEDRPEDARPEDSWPEVSWPADFGLVGSPDISTRNLQQVSCSKSYVAL